MGPRLISRGNDRRTNVHSRGPLASMGPRLISRGNAEAGFTVMGCDMLQWGRG